MKRLTFLVLLALAGIAIAMVAVVRSSAPVTVAADAGAPAPPFASFVTGIGITESSRGNVAIGTPVPGVVSEVYVQVGDPVRQGAALFKIDDRELQVRQLVAAAKVREARAALGKPRHRRDFLGRLQRRDSSAISAVAMSDARDDVRSAEAVLSSAMAELRQIEVAIERNVVRATSPGRVLQMNTRPGEFVEGSGASGPLMLVGADDRFFLRTDIDESDAWRIRPEAPAQAQVRGNPRLRAELRFEYIEPYVAPKTSLTGQVTERPDARVLQVVYSFPRRALPVYLGQQMDVFIKAAPVPARAGARQP